MVLESLMSAVNIDMINLSDNSSKPVPIYYEPLVDGSVSDIGLRPINKATGCATSHSIHIL